MKQALVVIDVQKALVEAGVHRGDELLRTIRGLIERARTAAVPVVFVVDDEVDTPGSPGWDVHPALGRREDEPRVRKLACDAFHRTELESTLRRLGVQELVVCGMKSQYCVDSTCRRAVTLGFPLVLVGDAHSTEDRDHLDAASIVRHENATLNGFGVSGAEIRVLASSQLTF